MMIVICVFIYKAKKAVKKVNKKKAKSAAVKNDSGDKVLRTTEKT